MKRWKFIDPKFFIGFCILEFLILTALKVVQAVFPYSYADTFIMFSATFFHALFMLFLVLQLKKAGADLDFRGIPLAVFALLIADIFLVLLHDLADEGVVHFITPLAATMIGYFCFGLIQVIVACHLNLTKRRLLIRIGFYIVFVLLGRSTGIMTFDRFIACLSMSQLILNVVYSWIDHHKSRSLASLLLAVGITLFLGGDILVLMRILLPNGSLGFAIVRFLIWIFYIPSQVLLTSSYLADSSDR